MIQLYFLHIHWEYYRYHISSIGNTNQENHFSCQPLLVSRVNQNKDIKAMSVARDELGEDRPPGYLCVGCDIHRLKKCRDWEAVNRYRISNKTNKGRTLIEAAV